MFMLIFHWSSTCYFSQFQLLIQFIKTCKQCLVFYSDVHFMITGSFQTIPPAEKQLLDRHLGPFMNDWGHAVQMVSPMHITVFRRIDDDPQLLCKDMDKLPFTVHKQKCSEIQPHPLARKLNPLKVT